MHTTADPASAAVGAMLVPQQNGLLIGKQQQIVAVNTAPQSFQYDSAPLYKERTFVFRPLMGYGERIQSSMGDQRYHWAMDCWVIGGQVGKGPLLHALSPPTTGSIRQFIDGPVGSGQVGLFVLAGANILHRTSDANAGQVVDHTRAGHVATSAVRFMAAGTTPVDALYVAWDDGVLEQRSGAGTWVTCTMPSPFAPNFLETVGPSMIAAQASTCVVRTCQNDPTVAGSWSGPIVVGNADIPITAIRQAANKTAIFKSDGSIWTINADGSVNDQFPGLRVPIDATNAQTAVAWQNSLWFRIGPTFYSMTMPDLSITPIGPERALNNASEVRGPVQAFAGWAAQQAFGLIYNPGLGNTYLITYGDWEPNAQESSSPAFQFQQQWDGCIAHWTSLRGTALYVSGAAVDPRLWIGFADGTYAYIKLVANPLGRNSGAEFNLGPASIVLPLHHAMFQADTKGWTGFSAFGPNLTQADHVDIAVRVAGSTGLPGTMDTDPLGELISIGSIYGNGLRIDAPPNISGYAIQVEVSLVNDDSTRTPVIEGIGIHERVIPRFRRDFSGTINASDWAARRDGAAMRQNGTRIHQMVMQLAASPNLAVLELPDETVDTLAFFDYTDRQAVRTGQNNHGGSNDWFIDFAAAQFTITEVTGIWKRIRGTKIGDLRGYQIQAMKYM